MKKLLTISLSAVIAVSVFALSACNDKESIGVINGNYKAATSQEVEQAINEIDSEKIFGDTQADDYKFGLKLSAELYSYNYVSQSAYKEENLNLGYLFNVFNNDGETESLGSGNFDYSLVLNTYGTNTEANYSASVYNENDYAYLDLTGGQNTKLKANIPHLVGNLINDMSGANYEDRPYDEALRAAYLYISTEAIGFLEEYNIDAYLDTSDGLKIKLSLNEDSFVKLVEQYYDPYITESALNFAALKLDFYLSIGSDGVFRAFGIDADIDLSYDLSPFISAGYGGYDDYEPEPMRFVLKGGVSVKVTDETVTIPENLASDSEYVDITETYYQFEGKLSF